MKVDHSLFKWDNYSDQPEVIRNRRAKRHIALANLRGHLKSFLVTLVCFVPVFIYSRFKPDQKRAGMRGEDFFGLCVNLDKAPELTPALVEELGIKKLLVRVSLDDADQLDAYVEFLQALGDADITVCIMQTRRHIEDHQQLRRDLRTLFKQLAPFAQDFQIGNAINRLKWGFVGIEEYLQFYQVVQQLRDKEFPNLTLIGSSVIDFEPVSTLRSLFHRYQTYYDKTAALLYVDRRGAPEGRQFFIFDLLNKIRFVDAAVRLSNKSANKLVITETNWPLKDTEPYAPAAGDCCVSPTRAADYLVRYYLHAWASGSVETVFWHQLFAPGYGLIDHRNQPFAKLPAFKAYQTLVTLLTDAELTEVRAQGPALHHLVFSAAGKEISVLWSTNKAATPSLHYDHCYSQDGTALDQLPSDLSGSVIYAIKNTATR